VRSGKHGPLSCLCLPNLCLWYLYVRSVGMHVVFWRLKSSRFLLAHSTSIPCFVVFISFSFGVMPFCADTKYTTNLQSAVAKVANLPAFQVYIQTRQS
jgi:hypothetical protein